VADSGNHVIRAIAKDGAVTTLNAPSTRTVEVAPEVFEAAGSYADGKLSAAKFNEPYAIAVDAKGNLYVSDSGNHVIRYVDMQTEEVTTVAGDFTGYEAGELYPLGGYADGKAGEALFNFPKGMALTKDGGLAIADSLNHTVRFLYDGQVTTLAGSLDADYGNLDGWNGSNLLHNPTGVAIYDDQ